MITQRRLPFRKNAEAGPRVRGGLALFVFAALSCAAFAPLAEAQDAHRKFVGVGSCASSNCHGSASPLKGSNVLQNEYVLWQTHDLHSKAWTNLTNEEGKRIGRLLGIAEPEKDALCLTCHATWVPNEAARGERYSLEDGVGCESCHGAGGDYLQSHAQAGATHADNIKRGMTDLVDVEKRAAVCLSCHYGTEDRVVNHRLIGAGHPRLSFELDTFGMIEPKHWVLDEDYRKRKGSYSNARAWLLGQVQAANAALEALASDKRSKDGIWPEFTMMYCFTCHHSLTEDQWKVREYGGRPGELKLNVSSLLMVRAAMQTVQPGLAGSLSEGIDGLHASFRSGEYREDVRQLAAAVEKARAASRSFEMTEQSARALLKQVSNLGASFAHPQYELAEQIAMGLSSLLATISPDGSLHRADLDAIYDTLSSSEAFDPAPFTAAVQRLNKKL